ncbi:hypothetical protein IJJ27_00920 [bacterium]|nr:hypothetical protein [bacterium]
MKKVNDFMKKVAVFLVLMFGFCQQVAATRPLDNIQIGDYVSLGNQQFIKLNDNGLLMMSATLSCPHGKIIAGKHVKCFNCPSDATYDSTNVTCTCNTTGYAFNIDTGTCNLDIPTDADTLNCSSPVGYLNTWHGCFSLATHDTVCLADPRDYRTYRVRKLADGKCWMVDSLKFGGNYGDTDGCSANSGEGNFTATWCGGVKAYNDYDECVASCQNTCESEYWDDNDNYYPYYCSDCEPGGSKNATKAKETFATGYYGHCRAIPGTYTDNYYNDTRAYNNYLYDWVAATQSTLAYYGSSITFSGTQQGICPQGWHLPTGSSSGEFGALYTAYNSDGSAFFDPTKGNFALSGSGNQYLNGQGNAGHYWSSDTHNYGGASYLFIHYIGYHIDIESSEYEGDGLAVRCVQDEPIRAEDDTNCSDPIAYMDSWTGCSSLQEHDTVCLSDRRDYRTYKVRKLADGKCWMVDSLKFGGNYGDTDGCSANNGTGNFSNGGSSNATKAQETFATGYYGHCRAINSTYNNYLYDWVAAMQSTLAYLGSSTTFTPPQQGICPTNWHLPTGNTSGEFGSLINAYCGSTSSCSTTDLQNATKGNFTLSGLADQSDGSLSGRGSDGYYWSSTAGYSYDAYNLRVYSSSVYAGSNNYKDDGLAVRCVRD